MGRPARTCAGLTAAQWQSGLRVSLGVALLSTGG